MPFCVCFVLNKNRISVSSYSLHRTNIFEMAPAIVSDIELPPCEAPETAVTPASKAATSSLFSLVGKTVAVTGGGRGLGITLALAIVEAGGNVACLDILESPSASEWAQLNKIAKAGGRAVSYHRCDVTDESAMAQTVRNVQEEAEAAGVPFWGAVACAGIQQQIAALDYPAADFDRILRVNVTGVFNTCKYTARALKAKNTPGSIVIIASMSGNVANRVCLAYRTSYMERAPVSADKHVGFELYRVQLEQSGRPANVPLSCPGMGPVRHPRQHALARRMSPASCLQLIACIWEY
jgi:NADP-dependent 3-hydroxy acid dehydrogenase YdfG